MSLELRSVPCYLSSQYFHLASDVSLHEALLLECLSIPGRTVVTDELPLSIVSIKILLAIVFVMIFKLERWVTGAKYPLAA